MHHYSNTPRRRVLGTVAQPGFELVHASGWPAVSPDGRTLVVSERTPSADRMALVLWDVDRTNPRRVYQDVRHGDGPGMVAGRAVADVRRAPSSSVAAASPPRS